MVFTEFVGGFGKVWIAVSPTANHWHGILPTEHGQCADGWTRFWLGSAGDAIQRIRLVAITVVFYLGTAATTKRNKGLRDDKKVV